MQSEIDKLEYYLKRTNSDKIAEWIKESLSILKYPEFSLRYNFCALGLREALRMHLESLSPDAEIESCRWYSKTPDSEVKITRKDRIRYFAYKNINIDVIMNSLQSASGDLKKDIDIAAKKTDILCGEYQKAIGKLSKYAHVLGYNDEDELNESVKKIISCFNKINEQADIIYINLSYIIQMHIIHNIEIKSDYLIGDSGTNNFLIKKHDSKTIEFEVDYDVSLYPRNSSGYCV